MDDKIIKLQIWDTAGQERFATITSAYYRGSHGILIAYDVTRRESFDRVQKWVNQVNVWAPDQTQILLIANKTDLPNRTVSVEEGQELAERLGCQIVETSAKDDVNVDLMFETIVKSHGSRLHGRCLHGFRSLHCLHCLHGRHGLHR